MKIEDNKKELMSVVKTIAEMERQRQKTYRRALELAERFIDRFADLEDLEKRNKLKMLKERLKNKEVYEEEDEFITCECESTEDVQEMQETPLVSESSSTDDTSRKKGGRKGKEAT